MKYRLSIPWVLGALLFAACAETPPLGPEQPPDSPPTATPPVTPPAPPPPPPIPVPPYSGPARIFVAKIDGTEVTSLTDGGWPAWAPDSRSIAFHRAGSVWVINADGTSERQLREGGYPAWSPDGQRLVFSSREGISVMDTEGNGVATLIRHDFREDTYEPWDMGVGKPAWSPDGKTIAFEHFGDGDIQPAQIFVMKADGSGPATVTNNGGIRYAESDPYWSPDGSRITFWSYGFGIAAVSVAGGATSSVYNNFPAVAYGARPTWSPDGRSIMFSMSPSSPGGRAVLVMALAGGKATQIIADGYDAVWSPDGTRIAFVRGN